MAQNTPWSPKTPPGSPYQAVVTNNDSKWTLTNNDDKHQLAVTNNDTTNYVTTTYLKMRLLPFVQTLYNYMAKSP